MSRFYYVYVIRSAVDGHNYVGLAHDLRSRLDEHQRGRVRSTRNRRPLELIYYEACRDLHDAATREKYLKTAWGKRYIKSRLRSHLAAVVAVNRSISHGEREVHPVRSSSD